MIQIRPVQHAIRGATLAMFVDISNDTDGFFDGTQPVRAVAKAVNNPQDRPPGDAAPDALIFSVTWVPVSGSNPAGWHLEASAAATADLDAGYYLTDVRIDLGGGAIRQLEPVAINLLERVTEAS